MEPFLVLPVLAAVLLGFIVVPTSAGSMNPGSAATIPEWIQSVWDGWFNPPVFHSTVVGLGYDDHKQYAYLPGRAGGQWANGGTQATDNLTLNGTISTTKTFGNIYLNPNGGSVQIGTKVSTTEPLLVVLNDAGTATVPNIIEVSHDTSGTAAANFGSAFVFSAEDAGGSTDITQAKITSSWGNPAAATRRSQLRLQTRSGSTIATNMLINYDGGVSLGGTSAITPVSRFQVGTLFYVNTTDGNVSIGVHPGTAQLDTTGTVRFRNFGAGTATFDALGQVSSVSDEKVKTAIQPFTAGLKEIVKINPIKFHYSSGSGLDTANVYTGFSAQDVQKAIPEIVYSKADVNYVNGTAFPTGTYTLSVYDRGLMAAMVNAIKEQQKEIEDLQARCR